jgi:hypothetical protein
MLRRARLPQAGIVADGVLLPVPATLAALACRPGALLHATFAGAHDPGGWRRFRFAVERIPKLEGAPAGHPLVRDIDAWRTSCRGEDDAAFSTWLRAEHDEHAPALSEAERWQRYIVWRDSDACTAMHLDQDRRFRQSDIPERVVRAHHDALHAVRTMLDAVVEATRAAC